MSKSRAERILAQAGYGTAQRAQQDATPQRMEQYGTSVSPGDSSTFRRREGDPNPVEDTGADKDYFGNLKSFRRTEDMAADPTRKPGDERAQDPVKP